MSKILTFLDENPEHKDVVQYKNKYWLLKETAAKVLNKSTKTLERYVKKDVIKQFVDQQNFNKVYYSIETLLVYENSLGDKNVKETTNEPEEISALAAPAPPDLQNLLGTIGAIFQTINAKLDDRAESNLQKVSNKIMLDVDEAATFSGFSKTQILKTIHAAERAGELQRFTGNFGKAVWRAADLDKIIESIPAVDLKEVQKRQPPPPRKDKLAKKKK